MNIASNTEEWQKFSRNSNHKRQNFFGLNGVSTSSMKASAVNDTSCAIIIDLTVVIASSKVVEFPAPIVNWVLIDFPGSDRM